MTDIAVIREWITGVKRDLTRNYERLGLKASGNWAEELEEFFEIKPGSYRVGLLGAKYTGVLTDGRKPNRNQNEKDIRKWVGWAGSTFIKDWVRLKKINANPYAVAYKIARDGIKVPNENNPGTLISDVVNDERIQQLLFGLGNALIKDVTDNIKNAFKST